MFSNTILVFLFGDKFDNDLNIQNILIIGLVAIILFRMLFGNILNAVGKAKLNVINALITFIIAIPVLILFTNSYGVVGTAYGMTSMFFISGIISMIMFASYLKKLKVYS